MRWATLRSVRADQPAHREGEEDENFMATVTIAVAWSKELHDSQFGFRRGRSTADVVACVRSLVERVERRGYVALAVSLDVVNTFNSISLDRIYRALGFPRVPAYLRGVVRAFLSDRSIVYTVIGGGMSKRTVYRGVTQGFMLRPLLWNIA